MIKGYVTNNTGKSKHAFKRTVYPGQKVSFELVYQVFGHKAPEDKDFVPWLEDILPEGWNIVIEGVTEQFVFTPPVPVVVEEATTQEVVTTHPLKETNNGMESSRSEEAPSLEFAPQREIDKLTARDIYNLRLQDNPKRVIKSITSVHKLRRALTMCKNDSRKQMLARVIQRRIRDLNHTA
jgi:hypothetical protein